MIIEIVHPAVDGSESVLDILKMHKSSDDTDFQNHCVEKFKNSLDGSGRDQILKYSKWAIDHVTRYAKLLKLLVNYITEEDVIDTKELEDRKTPENVFE